MLYARFLGWLHAVPEKRERSRWLDGYNNLPAPPLNGVEYLVSAWRECGMALSSGGYSHPLTWAEIDAWQRSRGAGLSHWERASIHQASAAYVNTLYAARDPDFECPYQPPAYWTAIAERVETFFS